MAARIWIALAAAALGFGAGASAPADEGALAERRVAETYDIYVGGLWLAEMEIEARFAPAGAAGDAGADRAAAPTASARAARRAPEPERRIAPPPAPEPGGYTAAAWLRTTGVARLIVRAGFEAEAAGDLTPGGLAPDRFAADSFDSSDGQKVSIRYEDGRLAALDADPAFKPRPYEVDPKVAGTVPDPLSAALMALLPRDEAGLCDRTVDVFDGRKRYAIVLGAPEARPDGTILCPALYRRIAGYKPEKMEDPEWPLSIWFDRGADGTPRFLRAQGSTPFGTAAILRRDG